MSSEWRTVEIASLCEGIFDGPHATPKKTDRGPIFLGISSLERGRLNLTNTEHLSEDDFGRWTKRVVPREGDIVFSYETRLGEVAIIPPDLRCCLGRRMALMRVDRTKALPEYVLYAYMSPAFQDVIRARTVHGSTVDRIPLTEFGSFPISVPCLRTQQEIAEILGALDDRIALLRETNKTLESIAQAIFKSWFVDFDPVRAKMEGRKPEGMDEETAALFPDSFTETGAGLVPHGWSLVPFGQCLIHTIGGDWGSETAEGTNDTRVAIIRGTDIPDLKNNSENRVPTRFTNAKKLRTRQLQPGDIVIEVSGGSKDQPTGRSLLITQEILDKFDCPVVPASFCRLFRPANENLSFILSQKLHFLYAEGKTWEYQNQSTGISNFQTTHFLSTEQVVVPHEQVSDRFSALVSPIASKLSNSQISKLTEWRDALLPRLISGQLRLPEDQTQLENALS